MIEVGVLVSGNGTNLQSIIDSIEAGRCSAEIKVVISNRPDAYALKRAEKHGIAAEVIKKEDYPTREAYDAELAARLKKHGVGLVVLAGFMRIITRTMLEAFPMRIVNIHPALLPSFPGLDVQKKAIEHGVKFSGCTVHFVDEGVDSGPIIIQAVVPVKDNDTVEDLSRRILEKEHRIYPEAIHLIGEGRLELKGRRVVLKDGLEPAGSLENPPVAIFADKTRP
ncbi:MAG: phosphoribosylglycinamide formyltransferase [Deltaproteobacteria bacterium]|nr:phosphoribosylglycinamide formyltransferase [Deltaproteobacteria bacterium]